MHQQGSDNIEIVQRIDMTVQRLEKLRLAYEQYFLGVDRLEPQQEKTVFKTMLNNLKRSPIRNTALRFRVNQLVARLNSYNSYWNRISRQIEEGTFRRDVIKARRRTRTDSASAAGENTTERRISHRLPDQQEQTAKESHTTTSKDISSTPSNELTEKQMTKLHNDYTNARLSCGEPTRGITKEVVAKSLRKQIPAIMKKYKCKSVSFKVEVKNGKAIIKAVPKS